MWLETLSLESEHVKLEPLGLQHAEGLAQATEDGRLWRLWFTAVPAPQQTRAYIETALAHQQQGLALPFAVINKADGQVIGSTRYLNVDAQHRRVEIGNTWYARRYQRTAVNTECKLLLLEHAFEVLQCIAVEFRTHWHNQASRKAIARLGAKQDGVLRNHIRDPQGLLRDTVVFSIIESEWPTVKQSLKFQIERYRPD